MTAEKLQLFNGMAWSTRNNVFVRGKFFRAAKIQIKPGRKDFWMMGDFKDKTSASWFVFYKVLSLALRCSISLFSGAKRDRDDKDVERQSNAFLRHSGDVFPNVVFSESCFYSTVSASARHTYCQWQGSNVVNHTMLYHLFHPKQGHNLMIEPKTINSLGNSLPRQ